MRYSAAELLLSITIDYYRLLSIIIAIHYYRAPFLGSFFLLRARQALIASLGTLPSVCAVARDDQLILLKQDSLAIRVL
jgi:hypothetical protein